MALRTGHLATIRRVLLPALWGFFDKSKSLHRLQLLEPEQEHGCSISVIQSYNGAPNRVQAAIKHFGNVIFQTRSRGDLFDTSDFIHQSHDFRVVGERFEPGRKSVWIKHPKARPINDPQLRETVRDSWRDLIVFSEEIRDERGIVIRSGLRPPQVGALHAIAAHWSVSDKPALVVMPTGTGKTEVMLACMTMHRPKRLLVLVPSDALRGQTFKKFYELGVLHRLGIIPDSALRPVTAVLHSRINSQKDLNYLEECNVVISTVAALHNVPPHLLKKFAALFDMVFFDEAHHIPANSWQRVFECLKDQRILQFTATPFRLDGLRIEGKIIYNFPLRLAQKQGYFRPIRFREVFEAEQEKADLQIARKAVDQLEADLTAGFDHYLLARADTIERAQWLFQNIYSVEFPKHSPIVIHSRAKNHQELLNGIRNGQHRIIVCVDMFGEGFDFPRLKIAALHDPHRSLAITLQFTGRFTRDALGIGDATLIANTADPKVADSIEDLYAEDSDWNEIIPELSAKAVESQLSFSDFLDKMEKGHDGDDDLFGLNVLRPKTSTVIFRVKSFSTKSFRKAVRKSSRVERVWRSKEKDLLVFITRSKPPIDWARVKETSNEVWDLFVLAYQPKNQLLFIHSSQTGTLHHELAKAVGGKDAELLSGERMFRCFHGINRLIFHNAGLYSRGKKLRFRLYTGLDIAEAIDPATQVGATKANLFAVGYEKGERVSVGASHKGRVWAMQSSSIPDWKQWCEVVAEKILDDRIGTNEFLKHTLVPKEISELPESKKVLSVTLPIEWFSSEMESVRLFVDDHEENLHSLGISGFSIRDSHTAEIDFETSDDTTTQIVLQWGPAEGQFSVARAKGHAVVISTADGRQSLEEFFREHPPIFHFMDGSEVIGPRLLEARGSLPYTFDPSGVVVGDWTDINIQNESKWKKRVLRPNTVQGRILDQVCKQHNLLVIDDDDSGEAADVIEIAENNDEVLIRFYHCKYAGGSEPSSRVKDLYEVCGQAVRSVRWIYDPRQLFRHIYEREKLLNGRLTRFEKGDLRSLLGLKRRLRKRRVRFEIIIVQPGLSKAQIDATMISILGAANVYILEMTGHSLGVIGST